MSDIKIFVSNRIDVDSVQIDNPIYVPVRCGAVFDDRKGVAEIIGDDTGDNVSDRRLSFCEETVLYWAWKNVKADYYGFCHYRRMFSFAKERFESSEINNHVIEEYLDSHAIKKYCLDDTDRIHEVIENTDIVTIYPMNLRNFEGEDATVYKHLIRHIHWFNKDDFNLMFEVLKEKYPAYLPYAYDYMNGHIIRGFNCYVLKADIFQKYCTFCFDVLFELEKKVDTTYYNQQMKRFTGFVSELLFGIFYNKEVVEDSSLITKHVQLVRFNDTEKDSIIMPKRDVITIVTTIMDKTAFSVVPFIKSTMEHASEKKKYEFVILCNKLSIRNKELLQQIVADKNNFSIKFFSPYSYIKNTIRAYSEYQITEDEALKVASMFIPYMFDEHKKVIFINSRAVIREDIAELIEKIDSLKFKDYFVGLAEDIYSEALYTVQKNLLHLKDNSLEKIKNQFAEITVHGNLFKKHIDEISNEYPELNSHEIYSDFVMYMNLEKIRDCISEELLVDRIGRLWEKQIKITSFELVNLLYTPCIMRLDYGWNIYGDVQLNIDNILKYAEYTKYEKYNESVKNAKIINYSGNLEPWRRLSMPNNVEYINLIKQTSFYEDMLMECLERIALEYVN